MKTRNQTALNAAAISGRIGFPSHSLTVVVKGLFKLTPGRIDELADDELAFPTGDIPLFEDDETHSEIRYASDFAYYKSATDLMLAGKCHPPGGEAVRSCRVTFQVGSRGRSLEVFGDRWWAGGTGGTRMTEPEPFSEMALSWERAYGGPECPDNPVGRGDEVVTLENGQSAWPLPNIEFPEQLVRTPDDRPAPAGFAPVPMDWEPRRSFVGTYRGDWLETRWPWFPEDLDWRLFNAAPTIMQAEGFLGGDEEVYLENIHPEIPRFQTRLPGLRVRCFLHELPSDVDPPPATEKERQAWSPPPRETMELREVPLNLDTVWIDPDAGVLAMVWRGYASVRDPEHAEVRDLFVRAEPLAEPPADLAACRAELWTLLDEEDAPAVEESPGPFPAADPSDEVGDAADEPGGPADEDPDPYDSLANLRDEMGKIGMDPDAPPEPTEEEIERAKEHFRERGMDDIVAFLEGEWDEPEEESEPEPPPWTRERVIEQYSEDRDLGGADLSGLDLSGITLEDAKLRDADLSETDLTGANLKGVDLTSTKLDGVILADAILDDARLVGCDPRGGLLRNASLIRADCTAAHLEEFDLTGTDLSDAVLDRAHLRGANLTGARAAGAGFVAADLAGAILVRADFEGADFAEAVLDRADAREGVFSQAGFHRVSAVEASFGRADMTGLRAADALDLTGADLSMVDAVESVWSGATLVQANLAWSVLDGADFTGTNLQGADLYAAHLRGARFDKANLVDARLATADGFEGSFSQADLARADLRGANFYAAEFLDARFWETATEGANFKGTKHE